MSGLSSLIFAMQAGTCALDELLRTPDAGVRERVPPRHEFEGRGRFFAAAPTFPNAGHAAGFRTGVLSIRSRKLAISRRSDGVFGWARSLRCFAREEGPMSQDITIDPPNVPTVEEPALLPVLPSPVRAQPKRGALKKPPQKKRRT